MAGVDTLILIFDAKLESPKLESPENALKLRVSYCFLFAAIRLIHYFGKN